MGTLAVISSDDPSGHPEKTTMESPKKRRREWMENGFATSSNPDDFLVAVGFLEIHGVKKNIVKFTTLSAHSTWK